MKINRYSFVIIELILLALVMLCISIYAVDRLDNQPDKIFVIMKNTEENYRNALIYGMRKAASDTEADLVVVSAGEIASIEEEQAMIQREIDNGADAIIVEPIPGENSNEIFSEFEKQIPLLLINSSASTDDILPVSKVDNYGIGSELADNIIKDYSKTIEQKTVGIVVEDKNTEASINREKGCVKHLEEAKVKILWSVSSKDLFSEESNGIAALPEVDIIVTLDDFSSIEVGNAREKGDLRGVSIYGIGNSTDAIYHLENRNIACLIVPDDFELGYESFTEVTKYLENKANRINGIKGTYSMIKRYDLFSDRNQKILYGMSQ